MGYVQRLSNGNTLIGWGTGKPDVLEVTPSGEVAMTMEFDSPLHSYRVFRDEGNHLSGVGPSSPAGGMALSAAGPNPFPAATEMFVRVPERAPVTLVVYDLMGRAVRTVLDHVTHEAGLYRERVDLAGRPSGVYFCRLEIGGRVMSRPIVLARCAPRPGWPRRAIASRLGRSPPRPAWSPI